MREVLNGLRGDCLTPEEFDEEYAETAGSCGPAGTWTLERRQDLHTPAHPDWDAFAAETPDDARKLLRTRLYRHVWELRQSQWNRSPVRTVRIVEHPLSQYMRWRMELLRLRCDAGFDVRALDAHLVAGRETDAPLSDTVTTGDLAAYEVLYDSDGARVGALRFTQPGVAARCRAHIQLLRRQAVPLNSYRAPAPAASPVDTAAPPENAPAPDKREKS